MKLNTVNGGLSLQKDFNFEISINNPFFSDDGASSLPMIIPASAENLAALGFPDRIGRRTRFDKRIKAVLSHGSHYLSGTLLIDSTSTDSGISGVLLTNESVFYEKYQDQPIKELLQGYLVQFPYLKNNELEFASNGEYGLVHHLWDLYKHYPEVSERLKGLAIFPIYTSDGYEPRMLNIPGSNGFEYAASNIKDSSGAIISVPDRYGITPFVYLWKLLKEVFESCGYEIEYNVFADPTSILSNIVVLNNCADTITPGDFYFKWSDLVPSVTVGELILWLKDKFGAGVFIKGSKINIRLLEDSLTAHPDIDLSEWINGEIAIEYPLSKRLVINYDTSIEDAAPPCSTSIDFVDSFQAPAETLTYESRDGFYFNVTTGEYYRIAGGSINILGSNAFGYDRKNSEASEDISCDDRFLPMLIYNGKPLVNIGERIHLNSSVNNKSEDSEQPIIICWAGIENGYSIGTTQGMSSNGGNIASTYLPPLTPEGLYPYCWKSYNELLLNGAPMLKVQLDLPASVLSVLDLYSPKYLNGQKVIIESLSYRVSDNGIKCGECTMRLLPHYADWIADQPHQSDVSYEWGYKNTYEEELKKLRYTKIRDVEFDPLYNSTLDRPVYSPLYSGIKAKVRKRKAVVKYTNVTWSGVTWGKTTFEFEEYFISKKSEI